VFAHGQRAFVATYTGTLAHLASHGFIVLAPRSGTDFTCPACTHAQLDSFASDVADAASWLASGAPGGGVSVDATRGVGLMGHSLGGGTVMLAAARLQAGSSVRVAGLLALAPADGNICAFADGPGASSAAAKARTEDDAACAPHAALAALRGRVPVLILAGERDKACPVSVNARALFAAAQPPAALRLLRRGTHCFTEAPGNLFGSECGLQAGAPDGGGGAVNISSDAALWSAQALRASRLLLTPLDGVWEGGASAQPAQLAAARRAAGAFFAAHAAGRADAAALTWATGTRASPLLFVDGLARLTAVK
jgi:dienelactone hydrolase